MLQIIDNWYFRKDKDQQFMVVAVDENKESVEIQHFDGDIEISTAPENWSGATDIGEVDDYGTEVTI